MATNSLSSLSKSDSSASSDQFLSDESYYDEVEDYKMLPVSQKEVLELEFAKKTKIENENKEDVIKKQSDKLQQILEISNILKD